MNQREQFVSETEKRLGELVKLINLTLHDVKCYKGHESIDQPSPQQPGESTETAVERHLTSYDKIDELVKRTDIIITSATKIVTQLEDLKNVFSNFTNDMKAERATIGDMNNPMCQTIVRMCEQKKNEDIQKNPSAKESLERTFVEEKKYWEGKKLKFRGSE